MNAKQEKCNRGNFSDYDDRCKENNRSRWINNEAFDGNNIQWYEIIKGKDMDQFFTLVVLMKVVDLDAHFQDSKILYFFHSIPISHIC